MVVLPGNPLGLTEDGQSVVPEFENGDGPGPTRADSQARQPGSTVASTRAKEPYDSC